MKKIFAAIKGKSKTVNFNALVASIVGILKVFGYEVPMDVVSAILVLGNTFLRMITDKAIEEK